MKIVMRLFLLGLAVSAAYAASTIISSQGDALSRSKSPKSMSADMPSGPPAYTTFGAPGAQPIPTRPLTSNATSAVTVAPASKP